MSKKKVAIVTLISLILLAIVVVNYNDRKKLKEDNIKKEAQVKEGDEKVRVEAIDFKLEDLNGKEIKLSDYKGKKIFLNFWASWCGPCKAEMPHMQQLYDETKDKNIVILAVNVAESKDKVKSFIENNKYTFPVLLDIKEQVAYQYGISAFPTSFFIDEEGYVYSGIQGSMTLDMMKEQLKLK